MNTERAGEELVNRAWTVLAGVADPEIPVLSIVDLGIVRKVEHDGDSIRVGIAPTYTGCPATEVIAAKASQQLRHHGIEATIESVLSPPWTTDWITEAGRRKLRDYGIAPPRSGDTPVACPRCGHMETEKVSEFGSTPCKASYKCTDCLEPFEYFKCL